MPESEDDEVPVSSRGFWSGTISFGLVSVPVNLLPATRSNRTSLRMVAPDGTPLSRRYFSTSDDRLLDSDDIVRAYEIEKDEYVVVEDEELEKLAPERTRDIDLRVFVSTDRVDPKHFERAYYLTPAGNSTKAYRLLAKVMEDSDRAGVATFVMRGKEYLIAILAENGILRAETLRFADEIRTPETIGLPEPVKPNDLDVKRIAKEIAKLEEDEMDTSELTERSAARLKEIVARKLEAGEDVVQGEEEPEETSREVIDLVEMLQRSLNGSRAAKKASPSASGKSESSASPPKKSAAGKKDEGLSDLTKAELYDRAQELDISGRSSMTKKELIQAISGG